LKQSLALFVVLLSFIVFSSAQTKVQQGVVDLKQWNFDAKGAIKLDGEWEIYMSELIEPRQFANRSASAKDFATFPDTWNARSKSHQPGRGFATYHLRIYISAPQQLALDLPHFYSNFTLWINNEKIASNGIVGKTAETSKPQWLPQIVTFQAASDTLDLVIHASNFHHAMGGVRSSIVLSQPPKLLLKREVALGSTAILCGALIIIAFTFVAIYFFQQENSALCFASLSLAWALREAFSNAYIVTAAYPDFPWELTVKIEYSMLYLTMIFAIFFVGEIFRGDVNMIFKYLFATCNGIFLLFTLFVDASFFTQFLPVYLSFAVVLLIYMVYRWMLHDGGDRVCLRSDRL
jgi:hypothetical protein